MNPACEDLWKQNTLQQFWQCRTEIPADAWSEASRNAAHVLDFAASSLDPQRIPALALGEQRFGSSHWDLGAAKRAYYILKPILPRRLTRWMRKRYQSSNGHDNNIPWPVEARYVLFLWESMRDLMLRLGRESLPIENFWPHGNRFALVLTHDIETAEGQGFVREVADLEEKLGLRSSFNFVPERYAVNIALMHELRDRGFEVGVHGLKHDGKLFSSRKFFEHRAARINKYLKEWQAVGFRADLMHRQPHWMQILEAEYDLSFFDTDPFEPIPGGTMSIWPFFMGKLVELPYTLVQDYTLTSILNEKSPRIWLEKVDFIETYHGMALVNSHPDYLKQKPVWNVYRTFLSAMKERGGYWHALPRDTARWWRNRADENTDNSHDGAMLRLSDDGLEIEPLGA